jgi:hypothetical protein
MQNLYHTGVALGVLSSISNITISGDIGDIGDRITLPTPVWKLQVGSL